MLPPSVKKELLDYIGGIQKDISEGKSFKEIRDKIHTALRMTRAAENGFCPWCGLIANHSPTASCTGIEPDASPKPHGFIPITDDKLLEDGT